MAPYECSVCAEEYDSEKTPQHNIDNSPVCRECVDVEILPRFQAALKFEYNHPPTWGGGVELNPNEFRDFLGDDFLERYRLQETKYAVPDAQRRYCKHTLPNNEACGEMLLPAKPVLLAPGQYFACDECKGKTCGVCELPVNSVQHACPGRPTDDNQDNENATDDLGQRGRDYQLCPNCGRTYALLEACNAVTCTKKACETQFCIVCGKECDHDSDHWKPGGCPRWKHPDDENAQHDPILHDPPVEIGLMMDIYDDDDEDVEHDYPRYEEIPAIVLWDDSVHDNAGMQFDLNVRLTTLLRALVVACNKANQAVPEWISTNANADHRAWVHISYALEVEEEFRNVVDAAMVNMTMCEDKSPHPLEHDLDDLNVTFDDTRETRHASILTAAVEELINDGRVKNFENLGLRDDWNGRNIFLDILRILGISDIHDYMYRHSALGLISLRDPPGFDAVPAFYQVMYDPRPNETPSCYINIACDELHRLWKREYAHTEDPSWAKSVPGFIDNEKHELWFHCYCILDAANPDHIRRAYLKGFTVNSTNDNFASVVRDWDTGNWWLRREKWDDIASVLNQRRAGEYVIQDNEAVGRLAAENRVEVEQRRAAADRAEAERNAAADAQAEAMDEDDDNRPVEAPKAPGPPVELTFEQKNEQYRQWGLAYGRVIGRLMSLEEDRIRARVAANGERAPGQDRPEPEGGPAEEDERMDEA